MSVLDTDPPGWIDGGSMGQATLDRLRGGHQELVGHPRTVRGDRLERLQGLLRDDEVKDRELLQEGRPVCLVFLEVGEVTALEDGTDQAADGLAQGERVVVGKGLKGFGFGQAQPDLQPGSLKPKRFPAGRRSAAHARAPVGATVVPGWWRAGPQLIWLHSSGLP